MTDLLTRFEALATDNAPGQEARLARTDDKDLPGPEWPGEMVDFSHGDVDAFEPAPGALDAFVGAVRAGGRRAYTEYRGAEDIRTGLAERLEKLTGAPVDGENGMILTPGTQGALFLALGSTVASGDKVAIVEPDYFANRKLVRFFGGEVVPVRICYDNAKGGAGIDLDALRTAFAAGCRLLVFSNPNNPTGVVYSPSEIAAIAAVASEFDATVICDQLYCRLLYPEQTYTHYRAQDVSTDNVLTIMGPSKFESLSGYRLGVAFGAPDIVGRMEKLQAIMSLRAAGYAQPVLETWLKEPANWLESRIAAHQAIRDDLVSIFSNGGFACRQPQGGSYVFPTLPASEIPLSEFVSRARKQAKVIVTPGTEFGPYDRSVRLNYSQEHSKAVAGANRLVELAKSLRS